MSRPRIEALVAVGMPFPAAVRAALDGSIRAFAERRGVSETAVSGTINGSTPYPQERVRDALAEELDVSREWLDRELLKLQGEDVA